MQAPFIYIYIVKYWFGVEKIAKYWFGVQKIIHFVTNEDILDKILHMTEILGTPNCLVKKALES